MSFNMGGTGGWKQAIKQDERRQLIDAVNQFDGALQALKQNPGELTRFKDDKEVKEALAKFRQTLIETAEVLEVQENA